MKRIFFVLVSLMMASCTSLQVKSSGTAQLRDKDYNEVFSAAIDSALEAGFTIDSTSKDAGIITASASHNGLLTNQAPKINIVVRQNDDDSVRLKINSIVRGQLVDYGTSSSNVEDFCKSFSERYPTADCGITE